MSYGGLVVDFFDTPSGLCVRAVLLLVSRLPPPKPKEKT